MEANDAASLAQDKFDLIYGGLQRELSSLIAGVRDLDRRLLEPIA